MLRSRKLRVLRLKQKKAKMGPNLSLLTLSKIKRNKMTKRNGSRSLNNMCKCDKTFQSALITFIFLNRQELFAAATDMTLA